MRDEKRKNYVLFISLGHGYEQPLHFSALPDEAVKIGYETLFEQEESEHLLERMRFHGVGLIKPPKIYELIEQPAQAELFLAAANAALEEEKRKEEDRQANERLKREALNSLTPEQRKALGFS